MISRFNKLQTAHKTCSEAIKLIQQKNSYYKFTSSVFSYRVTDITKTATFSL